jgi:hypothetical protein
MAALVIPAARAVSVARGKPAPDLFYTPRDALRRRRTAIVALKQVFAKTSEKAGYLAVLGQL